MPKLKRKIEKLDEIEEPFRVLYKKGSDGLLYLDDEVEGFVPTEKLVEFRDNNITLKKELEKYEGIDPVKYTELLGIETKLKENKLLETGKVDEIVTNRTQAMKDEYEKQIKDRDTSLTTMSHQLSSLLIDSAVKSAAAQAGVVPTAIDDVVLRAKTTFTINKEGNVVALDQKGQVRYGKNGTDPLSISDWVKDLKTNASHLFQGMQGTGARGGGPGGPAGDTSKMSASQKISAGLQQGQGTGPQPNAG